VATCGSDRMVLYWDLRKASAPVYKNESSESVVLSCDFFPGDDKLVSTTLEGEVNVHSLKDDFNTIKHITLENHHRTHIIYCCKTINNGNDKDNFLIGTDNKLI
jgi:WD40 repeat protein